MSAQHRWYACGHCRLSFPSPATLLDHVRAEHPEARKRMPAWMRKPAPAREPRPSLKRSTDSYPGRP